MRRFNVTGLCVPDQDYMVDISNRERTDLIVDYGTEQFIVERGLSAHV
ncbi:MAG: hypothetical protein LBQ76_03420 [Candidatus Fibromonas sp.]|jgi:hypothetical protein|nr:hypothetical protein [Candidatus Fibromonas sp.]